MIRHYFSKSRYLLMYTEHLAKSAGENLWHVDIVNEPCEKIGQTFEIEKSILNKRFSNGDTCFLIQDKGNYLGVLWGHMGSCYVVGAGKRLNLKADEVYLYGVFTIPETRRRNVFNSLLKAFSGYYSAKGIMNCYALVASDNIVMRTALRNKGFIEEADLFYIRIGGLGFLYELYYASAESDLKIITRLPKDCYTI